MCLPSWNTVSGHYRYIYIGNNIRDSFASNIRCPFFQSHYLSEERGSIPGLFRKGLSIEYMRRGIKHIHSPALSYLKGIHLRDIPARLFFLNMVISAIYTTGALSALYASLPAPERSTPQSCLPGLSSIATILLVIFADPKVSELADDVVKH